jgi:hypothetical protein
LDTVEGLAVVKGRSYPVPKINWGSIDAKIHVLVITTTLLVPWHRATATIKVG